MTGSQEVTGSSPVFSTKKKRMFKNEHSFFMNLLQENRFASYSPLAGQDTIYPKEFSDNLLIISLYLPAQGNTCPQLAQESGR